MNRTKITFLGIILMICYFSGLIIALNKTFQPRHMPEISIYDYIHERYLSITYERNLCSICQLEKQGFIDLLKIRMTHGNVVVINFTNGAAFEEEACKVQTVGDVEWVTVIRLYYYIDQ